MGEDQDAAGLRSLDEADRGDGLAGAGGVLEPEAALGTGVLVGRLGSAPHPRRRARRASRAAPPPRGRPRRTRGRPHRSARGPRLASTAGSAGRAAPLPWPLACPLPLISVASVCCSAISSVSVPESASTWWAFSSAPSRSVGVSSASSRSRPSSRENARRHSSEGYSAPASISASAMSRPRRRAVPGARASGPSPSSRKGSRANADARSMSALAGTAAVAATSVVLAMKAWWSALRCAGCARSGALGSETSQRTKHQRPPATQSR